MRRALLELIAPSVCPSCDRRRREGELLLCAACQLQLRPLPWLGDVATALAYEATGARLIQRFKFEGRRDALEVLVVPLAERLTHFELDTVVPVPRHPDRVREQGSDPTFDLARALARQCGLELAASVLERRWATRPQTELPREQRTENVRGSFVGSANALPGRRCLLLDDVTTTGATLAEAARELSATCRPRAVTPLALAGTPAL